MGVCSRCLKLDATHKEWDAFDPPMLADAIVNERLVAAGLPPMPDVLGVWTMVCAQHCDPNRHEGPGE